MEFRIKIMEIMTCIAKYWLEWLFGLIGAAAIGLCRKLQKKIKKMQLRQAATELGVQALLRAEIIHIYNKYMDRGEMPIYERENVAELFKQYTNLGGNGVIQELVEKLNDLPTPPQT